MKLKNVAKMRPMERYHYLRDTQKICTQCNIQNKLSSFFNKQDIIINKYCNKCNLKNYKKAIMKIVLDTIKSEKYNEKHHIS